MRRAQAQQRRSGCPIGIALDLLGDPWSLLVIRDLMFKGARSFADLLQGGECIATNILSDRLTRLESGEILEKRADPHDGRRFVYRLTGKGIDLAPVLVELVVWAAKHEATETPPATLKATTTDRAKFLRSVRSALKTSKVE